MIEPIRWQDGKLLLLDQRRLPAIQEYLELTDPDEVAQAIRDLVVRGAPAIGVTAAFGLAMGARELSDEPGRFREQFVAMSERMCMARPTAVNLQWAAERLLRRIDVVSVEGVAAIRAALVQEAQAIMAEDLEGNRTMGRYGAALLPESAQVLTHCNAGALATAGYGTALGVIRAAVEAGKQIRVLADETRPFLQGARLTAWEMVQEGIPCTVITDSMAGHMMQCGSVDAVVVGSDRIAANGDVANKIGTYTIAVLAREHGIPFYVAAPTSTVDMNLASGDLIPIEQRHSDEVLVINDTRIAPDATAAAYPAFDVTPARLVTAIITERGIARPPFDESLREQFDGLAV